MKTKSSSPKHLLICLGLAFAAYASPLSAAITTWTGASDNNWFNDANWTNHVPTASVDAFINTGKSAIYTAGANARTVTIGANPGDSGGLVVDGTNGGSLTVSVGCGGNTEDPNYIGLGIYVGYSGVGEMSILNGGTVTSGYGYIGLMPGDSTHKSSNGAVTIDGVGSTWTFSGCPDARLFVSGNNTGNPGGIALLSVTGGGIVTVNNYTSALVSLSVGTSGTVTGNGKILVNGQSYLSRLMQVSGTLAPQGGLEIVGNLNLPSTASTVQTVTPNSQDFIGVTTQPGIPAGQATVGGRLSVTMKGTFSPAVTRYTLMESDGLLSGSFSNGISITFPPGQYFTPYITYDPHHVYLNLDFTQ